MRIMGLAGWSGAGKTTLLTAVLPLLAARGLSVSTIKHAHHGFDLDRPGKDSWRHRQAGAREVLISSGRRFALLHELREEPEPDLSDLLGRLAPVDLVIVEGFKSEPYAKIEVHRSSLGKPLLCLEDPAILALATDAPVEAPVPRVALNDSAAVAELIVKLAIPVEQMGQAFLDARKAER